MGDQRSTLRQTADAAKQMLDLLRSLFDPDAPEEGFSLEIRGGRGGARLSHAHTKQYRYVEQTLMLWREILGQLTGLWHLCEQDLLFGKRKYSLSDTGQVMWLCCLLACLIRLLDAGFDAESRGAEKNVKIAPL